MAVSIETEGGRTAGTPALLATRLRWAVASSGVLAPVSALFLLGALPAFPPGWPASGCCLSCNQDISLEITSASPALASWRLAAPSSC